MIIKFNIIVVAKIWRTRCRNIYAKAFSHTDYYKNPSKSDFTRYDLGFDSSL